jgi:hypothetical protein
MHSPAPVPLRRPGFQGPRHPLPRVKRPVPRPACPDDTQSLGPQAVTGALFAPTAPAKADESTGITLPPAHSRGRMHGRSGRPGPLGAPERELLAALLLALVLSAAALAYSRMAPGALSATDLVLAGAVLLSGLGLLALGTSSRRRSDQS